jgi:hypothetical protein
MAALCGDTGVTVHFRHVAIRAHPVAERRANSETDEHY